MLCAHVAPEMGKEEEVLHVTWSCETHGKLYLFGNIQRHFLFLDFCFRRPFAHKDVLVFKTKQRKKRKEVFKGESSSGFFLFSESKRGGREKVKEDRLNAKVDCNKVWIGKVVRRFLGKKG